MGLFLRCQIIVITFSEKNKNKLRNHKWSLRYYLVRTFRGWSGIHHETDLSYRCALRRQNKAYCCSVTVVCTAEWRQRSRHMDGQIYESWPVMGFLFNVWFDFSLLNLYLVFSSLLLGIFFNDIFYTRV